MLQSRESFSFPPKFLMTGLKLPYFLRQPLLPGLEIGYFAPGKFNPLLLDLHGRAELINMFLTPGTLRFPVQNLDPGRRQRCLATH